MFLSWSSFEKWCPIKVWGLICHLTLVHCRKILGVQHAKIDIYKRWPFYTKIGRRLHFIRHVVANIYATIKIAPNEVTQHKVDMLRECTGDVKSYGVARTFYFGLLRWYKVGWRSSFPGGNFILIIPVNLNFILIQNKNNFILYHNGLILS